VRTDDDRAPVASAVRGVVRDLDARATLEPVATMEQLLANTMSRPRLYALLAGIFAAMAVSLASVGLYGLVAYTVAQRTREIGLRMALGAERARILGMMARQGLALAVIGIALGTAGAAGMTRYLEGMLFGLTPLDPATFIAVVLLFVSVAVLAACVPARRATRVDPLVALRYE
jgi:putative ABC transport system permease protein